MPVKYKLRLNQINENLNLKIPINLNFGSNLDQSVSVNKEFVEEEVKKSINPIIDYERTRFSPISSQGIKLIDVTYKPIFLNSNGLYPSDTYYSEIGFSEDDIKFRKNKFKESFLRLSFYDSDIPTNQNLVAFNTIFCRLYSNDLTQIVDSNGTPSQRPGIPKSPSLIPLRFMLTDPISKPSGFHEGFYLYYLKNNVPNELYMRAEFNNAANGKTTKFITTSETLPINELVNKLHVKYLLTKDDTGFYYSIDQNYNSSNNIIEVGDKITVNLYEIKVL